MTQKFGDIVSPAAAEAHPQAGDYVLIQRGNTVFRVLLAPGGQALPAAAAVAVNANAPAVVARNRGKWREILLTDANSTIGYVYKHLALHVGAVNVDAGDLLTAAHKGVIATKLWSVNGGGAFSANVSTRDGIPVWLVKGRDDFRLVASATAPNPGGGRWRLQIGFVEDDRDKANGNYIVAFDFGAATNWASS